MHSGRDDPFGPGCPIQRSPDRCLFTSSPGLFAGFHVFHRLLTPRHSPCALCGLVRPTWTRAESLRHENRIARQRGGFCAPPLSRTIAPPTLSRRRTDAPGPPTCRAMTGHLEISELDDLDRSARKKRCNPRVLKLTCQRATEAFDRLAAVLQDIPAPFRGRRDNSPLPAAVKPGRKVKRRISLCLHRRRRARHFASQGAEKWPEAGGNTRRPRRKSLWRKDQVRVASDRSRCRSSSRLGSLGSITSIDPSGIATTTSTF